MFSLRSSCVSLFSDPKKFAIVLFLFSSANLYLISALADDHFVGNNLPTIIYHLTIRGNSRRMTDFSVSLQTYLVISIILLFIGYDHNNSGFEIINALEGRISATAIQLNSYRFDQLQMKSRKAFQLCQTFVTLSAICACFCGAVIPSFIIFPASDKPIWLLVLIQLIACLIIIFGLKFISPPIAHLYTTVYYFGLRIKQLEALLHFLSIMQVSKTGNQTIRKLFHSHNSLCNDIARHSQFWKVFYFLSLVFTLPANICFLHPLLFGNLPYFIIGGYIVGFIVGAVYLFIIGFRFAQISYRVHKLKVPYLKVMITNFNKVSFTKRIKFLTCLERMSSSNRKIGFTCLTIFTVTYSSLFKVK